MRQLESISTGIHSTLLRHNQAIDNMVIKVDSKKTNILAETITTTRTKFMDNSKAIGSRTKICQVTSIKAVDLTILETIAQTLIKEEEPNKAQVIKRVSILFTRIRMM